jgi:HNH endonuclease
VDVSWLLALAEHIAEVRTPVIERIPIRRRLLRSSHSDENGCWLWTGAVDKDGYGKMVLADPDWAHRRHVRAHRIAYETFVGPIPEGLEIDHLCAQPGCINPVHLEPVTTYNNVLRSNGLASQNAHKAICKNGHLLTEENIYYTTWKGHTWRQCRECRRIASRDYQRRKRAAATPWPTRRFCGL